MARYRLLLPGPFPCNPLSNRACRFPARGLPMIFWVGLRRVFHGAQHFRRSLPTPPKLPTAQALHHEVVHLVELPVGIPRPEIVPPSLEARASVPR